MRFTTLLFAGAFALASAATTTTSTAAAAESSQQADILKCLNACKEGDVDCTAHCIAVPSPDTAAVNATNNCVADCPKGSGSATDNLNYASCVDGCIGKFYYTTTGTPSPTGASGGSGSDNGSGGSGGSGTGAAAPTGSSKPTGTAGGSASTSTGGAASASTSKAGAQGLAVAGSTAGFLGFLAALLAI